MLNLVQCGERTYYFDNPAKIGVFKLSESDVCLIDSGGDKDMGRKIRKYLDDSGWKLRCIVNTHSHADHDGGNKYLQQQTHCRIFAAGAERAVVEHSIFEPTVLFGGCPPKELKHKFLMAQESVCEDISSPDFPQELETIALPGHCYDMIAVKTPDNVLFAADSVCSEATLAKYGVCYLFDIGAALSSLDVLEQQSAALFVPSHAPATEDIRPLAELNRQKILEVGDYIESVCAEGLGFDDILAKVFDRYELAMTFQQHALVGSTVRSYLAWLHDSGRLDVSFEGNRMTWKKAEAQSN
ncbi:MAG: MBL fold metallo-hydrolase [Oscillospiraceae bacterium]|nr:MBL fold metallo-hydrolase [Oscillospiraceae bacterium]